MDPSFGIRQNSIIIATNLNKSFGHVLFTCGPVSRKSHYGLASTLADRWRGGGGSLVIFSVIKNLKPAVTGILLPWGNTSEMQASP